MSSSSSSSVSRNMVGVASAPDRGGAVTWEDIELSESYLVCGMFDEAKELASSVLMRILSDNENVDEGCDADMYDMKESAAMVLVQSLGESGRAADLSNELKMYCGDVSVIPAQVVLIGACILVAAGLTACARDYLEDFLGKWQFREGKCSLATDLRADCSSVRGPDGPALGVKEYVEVVDLYTVTLLGKILGDLDNAIFWVEKAQLPEEARQDLLRRLNSLVSLKTTHSSQVPVNALPVDESGFSVLSGKEVTSADKSEKALTSNFPSVSAEKVVFKGKPLFRQVFYCYSWFPRANIKFGSVRLSSSAGKILLWSIILIVGYALRKKRGTIITRHVKQRASSLKQALIDMWRLAFSYQVNPLAAVQAMPASISRGG